MGKMIHLVLYKILKCDLIKKWYMHKPESVQEIETQILRHIRITQSRQEDQN